MNHYTHTHTQWPGLGESHTERPRLGRVVIRVRVGGREAIAIAQTQLGTAILLRKQHAERDLFVASDA